MNCIWRQAFLLVKLLAKCGLWFSTLPLKGKALEHPDMLSQRLMLYGELHCEVTATEDNLPYPSREVCKSIFKMLHCFIWTLYTLITVTYLHINYWLVIIVFFSINQHSKLSLPTVIHFFRTLKIWFHYSIGLLMSSSTIMNPVNSDFNAPQLTRIKYP